MVFAKARKP